MGKRAPFSLTLRLHRLLVDLEFILGFHGLRKSRKWCQWCCQWCLVGLRKVILAYLLISLKLIFKLDYLG